MKYLFCLISFVSLRASAQSTSYDWITDFQSGQRIYGYGFEDYPTVKLFQQIVSDTNNVVILEDESFQYADNIRNHKAFIGDGTSNCRDIEHTLNDLENIYSYNQRLDLDLQSFSIHDPFKFDSIAKKIGLNKMDAFNGLIASDKQSAFIQEMVHRYSFSPIDSLLFSALVTKRTLEAEDFLKAGITKKIFFVRNYFLYNSMVEFERDLAVNSYLLIPRKGSKNLKGSNVNCNNRLSKSKEYTKLDLDDVPGKVRFTKFIAINKKDFSTCHFIYVAELNNCFW